MHRRHFSFLLLPGVVLALADIARSAASILFGFVLWEMREGFFLFAFGTGFSFHRPVLESDFVTGNDPFDIALLARANKFKYVKLLAGVISR